MRTEILRRLALMAVVTALHVEPKVAVAQVNGKDLDPKNSPPAQLFNSVQKRMNGLTQEQTLLVAGGCTVLMLALGLVQGSRRQGK